MKEIQILNVNSLQILIFYSLQSLNKTRKKNKIFYKINNFFESFFVYFQNKINLIFYFFFRKYLKRNQYLKILRI